MSTSSLPPAIEDAASGLIYRALPRASRQPAKVLLLLLHGVGGNELNLAGLQPLLDERVQLVLLRAPLTFGPQQYGWFQVSFGPNGPRIDAQQAERSRQQLLQLCASLQQQYGIDAAHTVLAGFSQGGIMSAGVALTAPQQVAGFGLLSGRILPEIAPIIGEPADLAQLSAFIGHGELDDKLPIAWAERATAWLSDLGVPHQLQRYPGGHQLSTEMAHDFAAWLVAGSWLAD
ncbi:alpha/beta hydrolase [Vogesella sp. LIG4]|uniref:alpha/beta hydrolase n=1 Tax=Vogesella sp. LIG4 TaxID=1192162 RepID=UPI00081FD31A|nr:phospholipase [Vogesella sp. LIG4]SCK12315.1 phospholipase/carboxylesterase [Vogesella sp. LIG4]